MKIKSKATLLLLTIWGVDRVELIFPQNGAKLTFQNCGERAYIIDGFTAFVGKFKRTLVSLCALSYLCSIGPKSLQLSLN